MMIMSCFSTFYSFERFSPFNAVYFFFTLYFILCVYTFFVFFYIRIVYFWFSLSILMVEPFFSLIYSYSIFIYIIRKYLKQINYL